MLVGEEPIISLGSDVDELVADGREVQPLPLGGTLLEETEELGEIEAILRDGTNLVVEVEGRVNLRDFHVARPLVVIVIGFSAVERRIHDDIVGGEATGVLARSITSEVTNLVAKAIIEPSEVVSAILDDLGSLDPKRAVDLIELETIPAGALGSELTDDGIYPVEVLLGKLKAPVLVVDRSERLDRDFHFQFPFQPFPFSRRFFPTRILCQKSVRFCVGNWIFSVNGKNFQNN